MDSPNESSIDLLSRIASILDSPPDDSNIDIDTHIPSRLKEIVIAIKLYCENYKKYQKELLFQKFSQKFPQQNIEQKNTHETCPICYHSIKKCRNIPCAHLFCSDCLDKWFKKSGKCPLCRVFLHT